MVCCHVSTLLILHFDEFYFCRLPCHVSTLLILHFDEFYFCRLVKLDEDLLLEKIKPTLEKEYQKGTNADCVASDVVIRRFPIHDSCVDRLTVAVVLHLDQVPCRVQDSANKIQEGPQSDVELRATNDPVNRQDD